MIRIEREKLHQMIEDDAKIHAYLTEMLHESFEKKEKCFQDYQKQCQIFEDLKEKEQNYREQRMDLENIENNYHREISLLELQRIFLIRQKKKAIKELHKKGISDERKNQLFLDIAHYEEEIEKITNKQDQFYDLVHENQKKKNEIKRQEVKIHDSMDIERKRRDTLQNNVCEWELQIEKDTTLFYEKVFEETQNNSQLLQDLVVRDLEKNAKDTKEDAKKKVDAILIGEEEISIDPPGKTRRLTKEEKEKYIHIQPE